MQHVSISSDVVVVGGGLAGVAAAIGAARAGARVSLVNNRPVLGGNASSEVRVWVCGATAHGAQKYARETGIMGELFLENQYRNPEGNPYLWDQVVLDAVRAEPLLDLYLNTDVREVDADGPDDDRTIRERHGLADGLREGAHVRRRRLRRRDRRRPRRPPGRRLVPHGPRGGRRVRRGLGAARCRTSNMLGSTMFFYTKDTGQPVRFVPPSIAKDITGTTIVKNRPIRTTANGCDYWWIEWGGELDAVDDDELIRDELWAVVYGIWDHIKNSGEFDADTLTLEWVGSVPGKREYRRFVGDHVLTQHDVMDQVRFDDAVGFGGWSIDLHPPGGMYADEDGSKHLLLRRRLLHPVPQPVLARTSRNMLMAGRNISASHVAFGSTRVMATCAVTGEAAGAGAALSARHGVSPRELVTEHGWPSCTRRCCGTTRPCSASRGTHPDDVAGRAEVTASSTLTALEVDARVGARTAGRPGPRRPACRSIPRLERRRRAPRRGPRPTDAGGRAVEHGRGREPHPRAAPALDDGPGAGRRAAVGHGPPPVRAGAPGERRRGRAAQPRPRGRALRRRRTVRDARAAQPRAAGGRPGRRRRTPGRPRSCAVGRRCCTWTARHARTRAAQVVGGLQRPFDGPQLWSSQEMLPGRGRVARR